jgi:hypothetical protein
MEFDHPGIPPRTFLGSGVDSAEPWVALDAGRRQSMMAPDVGWCIREITVFSFVDITVTP